jgi:hypothetical protein
MHFLAYGQSEVTVTATVVIYSDPLLVVYNCKKTLLPTAS